MLKKSTFVWGGAPYTKVGFKKLIHVASIYLAFPHAVRHVLGFILLLAHGPDGRRICSEEYGMVWYGMVLLGAYLKRKSTGDES